MTQKYSSVPYGGTALHASKDDSAWEATSAEPKGVDSVIYI